MDCCVVGSLFTWTALYREALKDPEVCWDCCIALHSCLGSVVVFAKRNIRTGLPCVFTEHRWLLANHVSLSLFFSCIKLPIFHFRWGCEAVLRCFFSLLHTHHLWSPGISDKSPDHPRNHRLVSSTQSDQDPSLGLSLFVWQCHCSHLSAERGCCGLSVPSL